MAFNTGFGVAWFLGSAAMGWLYDFSMPALIVFSMGTQLAAVPFFFLTKQFAVTDKSGAIGV